MTPVFYVPWLPLKLRGLACTWFIVIHRAHKLDKGLHEHERIHCLQMRSEGTLKYLWCYFTDDKYRAQIEFAAFKYGSKFPNTRIQAILVNKYRVPMAMAKLVCK